MIDAAAVDGRRRLILIRRDNVEHLLMIGGPTDVVVEPNIVRAARAARGRASARQPAAPDTLPRAVPLGEGSMWPLQPRARACPAPAPRPQRAPPPLEEPDASGTEPEPSRRRRQARAPIHWPASRRARAQSAGPAAELRADAARSAAAARVARERAAARATRASQHARTAVREMPQREAAP